MITMSEIIHKALNENTPILTLKEVEEVFNVWDKVTDLKVINGLYLYIKSLDKIFLIKGESK